MKKKKPKQNTNRLNWLEKWSNQLENLITPNIWINQLMEDPIARAQRIIIARMFKEYI